MKTIIVSCASEVATSTLVVSKVENLQENGIRVQNYSVQLPGSWPK